MFRALFCCLANSSITLWAYTKSQKLRAKSQKSGQFSPMPGYRLSCKIFVEGRRGVGAGVNICPSKSETLLSGVFWNCLTCSSENLNCLQTIYQRHSIAPKLYNAKSSICGPTFKFCSWQSSVRIYYTNMRSLLGLNFGMWMSQNEVANDNGMQRVGRETNIAQGQYCNIALGQYWFPFALDCDLNGIQHCSRAIL